MNTMTATESYTRVRDAAEKIKNDGVQRFPEAASVGDTFRQGDIYIEKIAGVPGNAKRDTKGITQLAPGTTRGSRHCLESLDGVTVYTIPGANALTGPVIDVKESATITHPEHGDVVLPKGTYAITYQRAYAEELRRVAD